jgi:hypothetical protein
MHQKKLVTYTGTLLVVVLSVGVGGVFVFVFVVVVVGGDATFSLSSGRRINRALWFMKIPLLERLASDPSMDGDCVFWYFGARWC